MGKFVPSFVSAVLALSFASIAPSSGQEAGNKDDLPLVWVLSTGGTIAGTGASSTHVAEYKGGPILGEELVKTAPEIKGYANVKVEQIVHLGSPKITLENPLPPPRGVN